MVGFVERVRNIEDRTFCALLWTVAAAVLVHDVYYLVITYSSLPFEDHSFRQTQTALTAYWVRQDGLRLAYETPVLGSPWSIPFEFPFYQWLVAALFWLGLPLEGAGRLISFAFLLACIWPFAIVRRALGLPRYALPLMTILFLAAPIYAFWGRAILIETCALFLALLWLALVLDLIVAPRIPLLAVARTASVGCLAILQKSTTFPAFGLVGGLCLLARLVTDLRRRDIRQAAVILGIAVVTCLVPLAVGFAWVAFTDRVKLESPAGAWLTSSFLSGFNYGTWAQRHSAELWGAIQRAVKDTFGTATTLALATIAACTFLLKESWLRIGLAVLAFLVPFATFTNLHILHSYYQVSNAVCLLAALAFALTALCIARWSLLALALLSVVVGGQLSYFAQSFRPRLLANHSGEDAYRMALLIKEKLPPDQGLVLDIGDWSSTIDLYSQRKGVAVIEILGPKVIEAVFADPSSFLGGMKAGAIVSCPPYESTGSADEKRIAAHVAGRHVLATVGTCRLLDATPRPVQRKEPVQMTPPSQWRR